MTASLVRQQEREAGEPHKTTEVRVFKVRGSKFSEL